MRIPILVALIVSLSGCAAIPPSLQALSYLKTAADGVSYVFTKKSTTDHVISEVRHEDCALHRIVTEDTICKPDEDTQIAYDADEEDRNTTKREKEKQDNSL